MGERIIKCICVLGLTLMCCICTTGCDATGLIVELFQNPVEELATESDTSVVYNETQPEWDTEAVTEMISQTESITETEATSLELAWSKYERLPYEELFVRSEGSGVQCGSQAVQLIENYDQLQLLYESSQNYFATCDWGYEPAFFEDKSLILIVFTFSGGEEFQSLDGIVINDGTLCPVITINSQEALGDDIYYRIMTVEVRKEDLSASAGKIFVINLNAPHKGSRYHKDKFE